jgi:hypothetical protein
MQTVGNTLLLVAVLIAMAPVMIVGRGSQAAQANASQQSILKLIDSGRH